MQGRMAFLVVNTGCQGQSHSQGWYHWLVTINSCLFQVLQEDVSSSSYSSYMDVKVGLTKQVQYVTANHPMMKRWFAKFQHVHKVDFPGFISIFQLCI